LSLYNEARALIDKDIFIYNANFAVVGLTGRQQSTKGSWKSAFIKHLSFLFFNFFISFQQREESNSVKVVTC